MRRGGPPADPKAAQGRKPRSANPQPHDLGRPRRSRTGRSRAAREGDLITGSRNKRHRHARRKSAPPIHDLLHLPDRHDATSSRPSSTKMRHLPKLLRNSLTGTRGSGTRPAQTDRRLAGRSVYFCDPRTLPVAARRQREHQRALHDTLPQRHRPIRLPGGLPPDAVAEELGDRPRKTLRVHETKREDHRTARRRVITSTTDNVTMEGRSNPRCCNHH